ncbi:hypothetical protein DQ04_01471140 [Trypanosoma grayi]|uniref:hypothetical protein n=1 Tax=Trypanosoma grayi TaxID=71804 RepID=UPI0004F436D4|nr:hypothetical protein DQ04_01471140 [Trypanosoma grayi]KEG12728.1 hypothetical protein DQ04_01471140 [Trypanosoma grayi]
MFCLFWVKVIFRKGGDERDESMATSWTLKRWGEMYGVPESAYEVAAGVRSVEAVLYHNPVAGPLCGLAVLLSSHIFLTEGASGRAFPREQTSPCVCACDT